MVNLSEYLDVGLFLDHRPTRKMVGDSVADGNGCSIYSPTPDHLPFTPQRWAHAAPQPSI